MKALLDITVATKELKKDIKEMAKKKFKSEVKIKTLLPEKMIKGK